MTHITNVDIPEPNASSATYKWARGVVKTATMTKSDPSWTVSANGTLRDALASVEAGGAGVALVIDGDGLLEGLLTDGDIRRAILSGVSLDTKLASVMKRNFTSVQPAVSRAEVLDLMRARHLDVVPIIDEARRLCGLHQLHDVIGIQERPNWAVVMAGGRGARLESLTDQIPKPMIRVAGRPILERLVLHLVGFGIKKVFLSINYLGNIIEDHFGDGSKFGCSIEYLREDRPLGTGGALALLPQPPTRGVLVINGDLVTQADLGAMVDFHERGQQLATVGVRPYFHSVPYGCIELDGSRVVRLEEKPRLTRLINAGIYVLSPRLIELVPLGEASTVPALLEGCFQRREEVRAFEIEDDWVDVGQREQLRQARGDDG